MSEAGAPDAATGLPIERFGLEIERDRGSRAELSSWDALEGLVLDASLATVVRFEVGELRLTLPPTLVLPERAWIRLTLTSEGAVHPLERQTSLPGPAHSDFGFEAGELSCKYLFPGEYEFTLTLGDAMAAPERIPLPNGHRMERRALYRSSSHPIVGVNTITRVELP